ncbi:MAG TPA: hypothetical protein VHK27_08990 [Gammaproteobacteria bacterium]|nr:hypothetical protein [Gammaproteobacteria bacterium]
MTIKRRISKLESILGGKSTKHYLWVRATYGESKEAAIDRHLQERGITLDDVGYMWLWGDDFCESVDYKNYVQKEDLIGYHEAMKELREWLDAINGQTLGPPNLRLAYEESRRRHEEIMSRRVAPVNEPPAISNVQTGKTARRT